MVELSFGTVVLVSVIIFYSFWPSVVAFLCRYAQYGEVSPKIDVYAFGVVLLELVSGKEAIIKTNEPESESKGLVALVVSFSLPLLAHHH